MMALGRGRPVSSRTRRVELGLDLGGSLLAVVPSEGGWQPCHERNSQTHLGL